jgi:hypothetical protein
VTRRRVLLGLATVLVLAIGFAVYQAWQVQQDLARAETSVDTLAAAVERGDQAARDEAIRGLQDAAASAESRTDGVLWSALTNVPFLGDDAEGVSALSRSLDLMARDGAAPLASVMDALERVSINGRIDVETVEGLREPVAGAGAAFRAAADEVDDIDSSGFVGALRPGFQEYVDRVDEASAALSSAETAVDVLPAMVGADGPRDYLLIFQNNAEIRATGGLPGAWAQIHAEDGRLDMVRQGTAQSFPVAAQPILPLTDEETAVYGKELGTYFHDSGFSPDFPRAAELWRAHWDEQFPEVPIDGVLALDPVAMSYLLVGTGPVSVGPLTLTPENVVEELLNRPYRELEVGAQDALFEEAAAAIFDAITGDVASPIDLVRGLSRAAEERRLLVAPFDEAVADELEGTPVLGELSGEDGATPHVDVGLNDATGSKMSYYLRYWAEVRATSCESGHQRLEGSMSMSQAIAPADAAELPDYLTGGGVFGTEPGTQLVFVRIYGPYGGSIDQVKIDGKSEPVSKKLLNGRPVITLAMALETKNDVVIAWSMTTGEGQTGDGRVDLTPGVQPGSESSTFASAC